MEHDSEGRKAVIERVTTALRRGAMLATACAAENVDPKTFIEWMRKPEPVPEPEPEPKTKSKSKSKSKSTSKSTSRAGPESKRASARPRAEPSSFVLDRESTYCDLGGVGSSFSAEVVSELHASFDPKEGVELWIEQRSPHAWLGDDGGSASEMVGRRLRSLEEIDLAISNHGEAQYGANFSGGCAMDKAAEFFPWLPTAIEQG
jgi:hypothetical protein